MNRKTRNGTSRNAVPRLTREAAAVKQHLDEAARALDYTYRTIGRLCGRLPDHPSAKLIYRSHMDSRERQECHIEDLKRAIRKLRNK